MIFHSSDFLIFFVVVLAVYWSLGKHMQNIFLLGASYFFYGYVHQWFLILILVSTVVDYFCGLGIERLPAHKKKILILSLISNLGMLGMFKYYGFFVTSICEILEHFGYPGITATLHIILPVGISFYTFQTLSYTIDIYRGTLKARTNFLEYALYVAFFPQLVAGPIERASRLLPQVEKRRVFDPLIAVDAFHLIMWGFFKKIVVADNVGIICNKIFLLENSNFAFVWTGAFAFGVQIFADFSAYTDIARGAARLLGFELMENFNHPYIATSPADYWRRWHISLSSWIRDYLYIPLGGSRAGWLRRGFNTIFSFTICGFWHGADWNYIFWGFYHGVFVFLSQVLRKIIPKKINSNMLFIIFKWFVTFIIVQIGWLLFREHDFNYILKYLALSPFDITFEDYQTATFIALKVLIYFFPVWLHMFYSQWKDVFFSGSRKWLIYPFKALVSLFLFIGIMTLYCPDPLDFIYFRF